MIVLFCLGCSTTMSPTKTAKVLEKTHYTEYTGKQVDWPIATNGMVNVQTTKHGLPIYHSLPNKPYQVMGTILESWDARPQLKFFGVFGMKDRQGVALKRAAKAAEAVDADALLVCNDPSFTTAGLLVEPKVTFQETGSSKMDVLQGILIRWSRHPSPNAESSPPTKAESGTPATTAQNTDHVRASEKTGSGQPPARTPTETVMWRPGDQRQAWLLAVGLSKYQEQEIPSLRFAKTDAEQVRDWFEKQQSAGVSTDNLRVLFDEQATRENLLTQIDWLRKQAMPEDLVIVYFAGHGAPELASDGKGVEAKYLVLYDTNPGKLFATGLPLDELTQRLDKVKAKTQVVILEACYAGAVGQEVLKGTPTADLEIRPRFIQEMGEHGGRVILSASSGSQIAIGSEEVKGGLFTHYLLKAWSEAGNKRLIADCFKQVWDDVRRAANKLASAQEPSKYGDQNVDVILGK
jgi:hypothetical protein